MISVLIADDQGLVRGAMAALLDLEPDIEVVAQVGRGDEVLDAVREHRPDVCVLDIEMPGTDGISAAGQLLAQGAQTRVLIVTTFGRAGYLRRAMDAGVSGFVVKDTPAAELAEAVRRVAAGLKVVDPSLATESLMAGPNPLTEREQEVLRQAQAGATVQQIAGQLFLSPGTVRNYLSSAIGKTGATTRVEAALLARDRGWL